MSQGAPEPYGAFGGNVKVELDLLSYATKLELKEATGIDISYFALKFNLAGLKTDVDKIDVDKLKISPIDLSKLSIVVKKKLLKKLCMTS